MKAVLAIDPSARGSGVALIEPRSDDGPARFLSGWTFDLEKVAEQDVLQTLDDALGERFWLGAIERPYNRRGPAFGFRWWRTACTRLARRRAKAAGVRFRHPAVLLPFHQQWRAPLGLPTQGSRDFLKAVALARARAVAGHEFDSDDAAEAALLGFTAATWAALCDPRWFSDRVVRWVR